MKYQILQGVSDDLNVAKSILTREVERALVNGWKLVGGVSFFVNKNRLGNTYYLFQAVEK